MLVTKRDGEIGCSGAALGNHQHAAFAVMALS
jgi:hypothetical protein